MIDWKQFLQKEEFNCQMLNARGQNYLPFIENLKKLYALKSKILIKVETFQAQVNQYSSKNHFHNTAITKTDKVIHNILKATLKQLETKLLHFNCLLPNIPDISVPIGNSEQANKIIRTSAHQKTGSQWSHWQIAEKLQWLEKVKAVEMSYSRFVAYQNEGAKMLRVLQNFMLDQHVKNGYQELFLPHLVKEDALWGTGQFPKMKQDCYQLRNDDLFLIPTSEVTLVNYFRDQTLTASQLPLKLCSYSLCFRRESGAAGKKTSGLTRLHQFHKVELVKFVNHLTSDIELEKLLLDSERILQLLNIPYRVVLLCTGDLGFSASKTYDLEVWMPFQQKYLEVASISNTKTFQSSYLKIKYRDQNYQKHFTHILNGSGLAIDRLIACLLEQYYDDKSGRFIWPKILQSYLRE